MEEERDRDELAGKLSDQCVKDRLRARGPGERAERVLHAVDYGSGLGVDVFQTAFEGTEAFRRPCDFLGTGR